VLKRLQWRFDAALLCAAINTVLLLSIIVSLQDRKFVLSSVDVRVDLSFDTATDSRRHALFNYKKKPLVFQVNR